MLVILVKYYLLFYKNKKNPPKKTTVREYDAISDKTAQFSRMTKIYLLKGECHYFHTRACVLMKLLNLDPELHAADMVSILRRYSIVRYENSDSLVSIEIFLLKVTLF